jgi:hypothetical protein
MWIKFTGPVYFSDKSLFRAAKHGNVEEIKRCVVNPVNTDDCYMLLRAQMWSSGL